MTKPVIVTDVDAVLLDWLKGFTLFLNSKDINTDHIQPFIGTTKFIETPLITKIDCEQTNSLLLREFSKSVFLKNLESFQQDSAQHLKELSKDFDFIALSCISKNGKIKKERTLNLQKNYGDIFLDVLCIGYGQSKEPYLAKLKESYNVCAFVDDRMKHIQESISAGVDPILFSRGVDLITPEDKSFVNLNCWSNVKTHINKKILINNFQTIPTKKNTLKI